MAPTTSWMWANENGGVNGVNIDVDGEKIHWFDDAVACACGDSSAVQNFEHFEQSGPIFGNIPGDILEELHQSVVMLRSQHPQM